MNIKITWEKIIELEPRLLELYNEALHERRTRKRFCVNMAWHSKYKPKLVMLCGYVLVVKGDTSILATSKAYDIAYSKILNVLNGIS